MRPVLRTLRHFVKHPVTQLVTGVALLTSGGVEIVYDLINAERSFHLGVPHGVALLGLIQVLGSLPELIDGIDRALTAVEKPNAEEPAVSDSSSNPSSSHE